jgi:hypothetical protein
MSIVTPLDNRLYNISIESKSNLVKIVRAGLAEINPENMGVALLEIQLTFHASSKSTGRIT